MFFAAKKAYKLILYKVLSYMNKQGVREIIIHLNDNDIRAFLRSSWGPSSYKRSEVTYDGSL